MKTIGFIGSGNMGQAMIGGIIHAGLVKPEGSLLIQTPRNWQELEKDMGVSTAAKATSRRRSVMWLCLPLTDIYPIARRRLLHP